MVVYISFHQVPPEVYDKLPVEEGVSGHIRWKRLEGEGFEIAFFSKKVEFSLSPQGGEG